MSRFITTNKDGTYLEEIENMDKCKWLINEICCNDKCDCLGDYPYPSSICESKYTCGCFEKENGFVGNS